MDWLTDLVLIVIALAVAYPWVPATAFCLVLLFAIMVFLRWIEGPTTDYDDTESGVGRPL